MAAAGVIAAEEPTGAGAKDELVARIIPAALEDGALHGGKDVAFIGAGFRERDGLIQRVVGQGGGTAVHLDLGRGLDAAQGPDQ